MSKDHDNWVKTPIENLVKGDKIKVGGESLKDFDAYYEDGYSFYFDRVEGHRVYMDYDTGGSQIYKHYVSSSLTFLVHKVTIDYAEDQEGEEDLI